MSKKNEVVYVKENSNYDGDNQHFSLIGNAESLKKWLADGSIEAGDVIGEWRPLSVAVDKSVIRLELMEL